MSSDVDYRRSLAQQSIDKSRNDSVIKLIRAMCLEMKNNPQICKTCKSDIDAMLDKILAALKML